MALRRISLRDFVIVRALELDFSTGFTALTGETGAGKSILIDALQLALGSRADAGAVREGCERLDVSVEFDADPALASWLDGSGFEANGELLLRRTVDLQGRSRAWINGSPATATQLRALGERLLDIHGQHAWQSLTRADAARGLLDAYAGMRADALDTAWQAWRHAQGALASARSAQDSVQRERERLQWQIAEVAKLAPGTEEWDELSASHTRTANAQALIDVAQQAHSALADDDAGAVSALTRALASLQNCEHMEPEFRALGDVLASSVAQATDVARSLQSYARHTDSDPRRLAELDERMGLWMSLARRYRRPPSGLPALLAAWQSELQTLDEQSDLDALERAERSAQEIYMKEATALATARKEAAPRLARAITQAMQGLGMQGGSFEVVLETLAQPARAGLEDVAFLVSGHAGSSARPIGKVASGGELSRIALAIAVTTSELGTAQALIFDEVDAGIGGAVAETVGRLMKRLGRDRQVLAVTHLAQVAACADHHLLVAKQRIDAPGASTVRTESCVMPLDDAGRVQEVARMLGGAGTSATSIAHAREMLGTPGHPERRRRATPGDRAPPSSDRGSSP